MNYDDQYTKLRDFLLNHDIASEAELMLATALMGFNIETLERVLYVKTGYRSVEQLEFV